MFAYDKVIHRTCDITLTAKVFIASAMVKFSVKTNLWVRISDFLAIKFKKIYIIFPPYILIQFHSLTALFSSVF